LLFGDLLGSSNVKDSRIVHQNVETTEMFQGEFEDAVNLVVLRNIRRQNESAVADLVGGLFEELFPATDQGNPSAFARQRDRARTADTAASAGDDGNFLS